MKIENRTFIVSGGSSGLGLATVKTLLSSSSYVSVIDISPPPIATHANLKFIKTDITNTTEIQHAIDDTVAWTKQTGAHLAGVVNCAGIGAAAKIIDANNEPHTLDLWDRVLAVNLTGTFNLTRLVLKHLIHVPAEPTPDGERGIVIFVSSAAAFEGQPGQSAYAATKGALRSMALPLARDLARHAIRVVAIAPGVFASAMTSRFPARTRANLESEGTVFPARFGRPEEFAQTVRWVLECPYVNGETVRLSGAGRLPGKL